MSRDFAVRREPAPLLTAASSDATDGPKALESPAAPTGSPGPAGFPKAANRALRDGDAESRAIRRADAGSQTAAPGEAASAAIPPEEVESRVASLTRAADRLRARGHLDEALNLYRDQVLPLHDRLDDPRRRAQLLGKIADLLEAHGARGEALALRRFQILPILDELGDERALTVLAARLQQPASGSGGNGSGSAPTAPAAPADLAVISDLNGLRLDLAISLLRRGGPVCRQEAAEQLRRAAAGVHAATAAAGAPATALTPPLLARIRAIAEQFDLGDLGDLDDLDAAAEAAAPPSGVQEQTL